jgi:pyrroline-5-carboxylate reductase
MGIAVLSGVLASLDADNERTHSAPKWESHTPGTLTPTGPPDASIPTRFLTCVSREESAAKLRATFSTFGGSGIVEVLAAQNVKAVRQSDVILLWYAHPSPKNPSASHVSSCKPQIVHTILGEEGMEDALAGKLMISILAGVTIQQLASSVLPSTKVIRAMPNTPCKVPYFVLRIQIIIYRPRFAKA